MLDVEELEPAKRHIWELLVVLVHHQDRLYPEQKKKMREAGAFLSDDFHDLPQDGNNPHGFDWTFKS